MIVDVKGGLGFDHFKFRVDKGGSFKSCPMVQKLSKSKVYIWVGVCFSHRPTIKGKMFFSSLKLAKEAIKGTYITLK